MTEFSDNLFRERVTSKIVRTTDGYGWVEEERWIRQPNGTHITSQHIGHPDLHLPVIDDDLGLFKVFPSVTPGHQHVYIEKPIPWRQYKKLLKLLAKNGLADPEWVKLSLRRGKGFLRVIPPPPKPKPEPPKKLPRPDSNTLVREYIPKDPYNWGIY